MADLKCMPLKKVTDGPLFGQPIGTLSSLVNMDIDVDGYAEARGGIEKVKPVGGSQTDPISSGAISCVHELNSPYGASVTYDKINNIYSGNQIQSMLPVTPFASGTVDDAIYFGADEPFSTVYMSFSIAASWTVTVVYEYFDGTNFNTALTTATTPSFTTLRTVQSLTFKTPSNWAKTSIGGANNGFFYKYWVRMRLSSVAAVVTLPLIGNHTVVCTGINESYIATQDPLTSLASEKLMRYDINGTTGQFFTVATSLTSSRSALPRMVNYRGRVIFVNGVETKTWDGSLGSLGIPVFSTAMNLTRQAGAGIGVGIWRYYAAVGWGPPDNTSVYAVQQDAQCRYGVGQATLIVPTGGADPADANSIQTTAGNEVVRLDLTGVPVGSAVYYYRTQDLTNVPVSKRSTVPAFLVQSIRVTNSTGTVEQDPYDDNNADVQFPPTEAKVYDVSPPSGMKYITVHQNRLVLANDETMFWSDPFTPDVWSQKSTTAYMRFTKATGGRIMNIADYADQIVSWTEEQTWGVTNIDLDIPFLFPIHPGVGLIASDGWAAGDGKLIWPSKTGFQAWDGNPRTLPTNITGSMNQTLGKMSYSSHGGSRACVHDRKYAVRLASATIGSISTAWRYSYDSQQWAEIQLAGFTSTLFPVASIHAPPLNSDTGVIHPVWVKADYGTGAGNYSLFLGELTTQDNGSNYTCSATMHFPQPPAQIWKLNRLLTYYQASDGWGTPTLLDATTDKIGSGIGTLNTGIADTGDDYSLIAGTPSSVGRGYSDVTFTFSVASAASGTVNRQRFFGGICEGTPAGIRRGAV